MGTPGIAGTAGVCLDRRSVILRRGVDGIAEPVRVRFTHVTDDDILHSGQPVEHVTVSGPVIELDSRRSAA